MPSSITPKCEPNCGDPGTLGTDPQVAAGIDELNGVTKGPCKPRVAEPVVPELPKRVSTEFVIVIAFSHSLLVNTALTINGCPALTVVGQVTLEALAVVDAQIAVKIIIFLEKLKLAPQVAKCCLSITDRHLQYTAHPS